MTSLQVLLLSCAFVFVHGFLPRLSPLESLIAKRTVFSVINDRMNDELLNDTILRNSSSAVMSHYYIPFDVFYFSMFLFTLYWRITSPPVVKLEKIESMKTARRHTNSVLFIIYLLFVKNIECAF